MADTPGKLVFWRPADGSGKLVFGDHGGAVAIPDADLALDADFATDLAAHIGLAPAAGLGIDAGFADDMAASVAAAWDANAHRSTLARAAPHMQQAQPLAAAARAHWQASQPLSVGHRPHWQRAQRIAGTARPHWQASLPLRATARPAFQQGRPAAPGLRLGFQQSIALRAAGRPAFQQGLPIAPGWQLAFQQTIQRRAGIREHEQYARPIQHAARAPLRAGQPLPRSHRPRFQQGRYPPPGRTPIVIAPPERELCYDPARLGLLVFERAFTGDGKLVFVCRKAGGGPGPQPGDTVVVPLRRVYVMINDLSLQRADDGTPILADAFAMALDAQSWTWTWSASLPLPEQDKIEPDAGGNPAEVLANVNGVAYRLLAERTTREREFGKGRVRVQGRGRSALLDEPYALVQAYSMPAERSAQQLMEDALLINGVSSGWALDWHLTDWLIPAGTWTHQGAPMAAVLDIAASVSAMVLPHRTAQTLRVLPRYAAAPWDWASLTPDFELPAAVVQTEGLEPVLYPAYDRVIVAGATEGGVSVGVTRAGKPGTVPRPMVTHPLITHVDAARQRGVAELAMAGRVETVSIRLPVLPATGVIEPGAMVRYVDGVTTRLGAVRAVALEWTRPTLRQTLTLETHP